MIPIQESVLSLDEARAVLPRRRRGRRPTISCMYRWTTIGFRGVVLESLQVGATRCTSVEALGRFFELIAAKTTERRTRHSDTKRAQAAGAKLDEIGITPKSRT